MVSCCCGSRLVCRRNIPHGSENRPSTCSGGCWEAFFPHFSAEALGDHGRLRDDIVLDLSQLPDALGSVDGCGHYIIFDLSQFPDA